MGVSNEKSYAAREPHHLVEAFTTGMTGRLDLQEPMIGSMTATRSPKTTRAVGNALGSNPVAIFIPCHRVILASGAIGNYHWGVDRKRSLLAWERRYEK